MQYHFPAISYWQVGKSAVRAVPAFRVGYVDVGGCAHLRADDVGVWKARSRIRGVRHGPAESQPLQKNRLPCADTIYDRAVIANRQERAAGRIEVACGLRHPNRGPCVTGSAYTTDADSDTVEIGRGRGAALAGVSQDCGLSERAQRQQQDQQGERLAHVGTDFSTRVS